MFQRATQTYLWALPLSNTLGMKNGSEKVFGAGYNVLPIWEKRLHAKTLVTTPNSAVLYAMSYLDLGKDGPMVLDAPPGLQRILLDFWRRPIPVDGGKFAGDVGLPGPEAGKGGKFLIPPPGSAGAVPPGCFVYRSGTNNVFVFPRGLVSGSKKPRTNRGPKAPEGNQSNWLARVPGEGYCAISRLYGPTAAAIARSWKPGNLECVKSPCAWGWACLGGAYSSAAPHPGGLAPCGRHGIRRRKLGKSSAPGGLEGQRPAHSRAIADLLNSRRMPAGFHL